MLHVGKLRYAIEKILQITPRDVGQRLRVPIPLTLTPYLGDPTPVPEAMEVIEFEAHHDDGRLTWFLLEES